MRTGRPIASRTSAAENTQSGRPSFWTRNRVIKRSSPEAIRNPKATSTSCSRNPWDGAGLTSTVGTVSVSCPRERAVANSAAVLHRSAGSFSRDRNSAPEISDGSGRLDEHALHEGRHRRRGERRASGQHLVEHAPEAVNVRTG